MLSGVFHLLCRFEIHALLSGVFLWNAFWYIPIECFRMFLSEMLSDVFQWNAFRHIPVDCFRERLSGTFQWYAFGHQSVFEHISVEAFGCIFKWNALGFIPVEYFLACSCGLLSGIVELNAFG